MIIKKSTRRAELEQFDFWYNEEKLAAFPSSVRKELLGYNRGLYGEADTAFYLDREFVTSGDHALIHDLRIQDVSGTYAPFDQYFFRAYRKQSRSSRRRNLVAGCRRTRTGNGWSGMKDNAVRSTSRTP